MITENFFFCEWPFLLFQNISYPQGHAAEGYLRLEGGGGTNDGACVSTHMLEGYGDMLPPPPKKKKKK